MKTENPKGSRKFHEDLKVFPLKSELFMSVFVIKKSVQEGCILKCFTGKVSKPEVKKAKTSVWSRLGKPSSIKAKSYSKAVGGGKKPCWYGIKCYKESCKFWHPKYPLKNGHGFIHRSQSQLIRKKSKVFW